MDSVPNGHGNVCSLEAHSLAPVADDMISSYPCGPCILSILPNNSAGHYKKATTVALQLALANCGYVAGIARCRRSFSRNLFLVVSGFVATFVYDSSQAPTYIRGHSIVLGFVCVAWLAMFCNV